MSDRSFVEELERRVLVCDGAMGTMLYAKGVFLNRCFDELNLTQPDLVAEVHQAYVRAGADVIETNTFGANPIKLESFGLGDRLHAINVQGVRIARHAARETAFVAGAIGPLGVRIEPWGKTGLDEAETYFRLQAAALLEGGVDLFILETFRDLAEIGAAIAAVRSLSDLPIVAQVTTQDDGSTLDGAPPEAFVPALESRDVQVLGLNCSVGPAAMLETVERMAKVTHLPISAQPNAGRPREIDGRNLYLSSPDYVASYARRFVLNGVKLVGGCCGTTPEHIRAVKAAVRAPLEPRPPAASPRVLRAPADLGAPPSPPVPREEKSRMANLIARGAFLVAVELPPPRGDRREELIEHAQSLKIRGADVIVIPDGQTGGGRMSALSAAVLIEQHAGIETVLQYSCRDRTLLHMQSDLLGASALGLRNLLVVTGEPPARGDYPDATGPVDVDSIGLTNVVSRLNVGLDIAGQQIGRPTGFFTGVAVNTSAADRDREIRRFEYKVEAGAEYAVTQPVFDLDEFDAFCARVRHAGIPILASVMPLDSLRQAEFLANEVPGVTVPPDVLRRMRRCEGAEAAAVEGLAIAREVAAALRSRVRGIQILAAPGRLAPVLFVMEAAVTPAR